MERKTTNKAKLRDGNEHPDNFISPERVMLTVDDPENKIFDNFLNEVYGPEQIQVKNRLLNFENQLDVVETLHTEIPKI